MQGKAFITWQKDEIYDTALQVLRLSLQDHFTIARVRLLSES